MPMPPPPDLIIRDALLIDGSGAPAQRGDLAVKDDRIVGIGDLSKHKGAREISANGLALAPGFVDTHTHDDRALLTDPADGMQDQPGRHHGGRRQLRHHPRAADDRPLSAAAARHHRPRAEAVLSDIRRLSVGAGQATRRRSTRSARSATRHCGSARCSASTARPTRRKSTRCAARSTRRWSKARSAVDRALLSTGEGRADRRDRRR